MKGRIVMNVKGEEEASFAGDCEYKMMNAKVKDGDDFII